MTTLYSIFKRFSCLGKFLEDRYLQNLPNVGWKVFNVVVLVSFKSVKVSIFQSI